MVTATKDMQLISHLMRRSHLGIKGLNMGRTTLKIEHHHAFACKNIIAFTC